MQLYDNFAVGYCDLYVLRQRNCTGLAPMRHSDHSTFPYRHRRHSQDSNATITAGLEKLSASCTPEAGTSTSSGMATAVTAIKEVYKVVVPVGAAMLFGAGVAM